MADAMVQGMATVRGVRRPARLRPAALALIAAGLVPAPASTAAPRRIVSLNLCADQYVVALADPARIAGLSRFARDPQMSHVARRAATLPIATGSAEQVLMLRPDLVIGAPFRQRDALAPLAARHVPMIDLPPEEGLAGIEASITLVAAAIGRPARGRALIASIRARLARLGPPPGRGRVAAYYQRNGYVTGTGTLVDEAMTRVGLVNLARREQLPVLSRLSVERMALARPDFLVFEAETARVVDRGTELLHHPLLDRAVPPARRLAIPQALTVCGGPGYPDAVAALAAQIRAADRRAAIAGTGIRSAP